MKNINLQKRRGKIVFSRESTINNPNEKFLKTIFSEFFPMFIDPLSIYDLYDNIKMVGYSKHFRELLEAEVIPEYECTVSVTVNGNGEQDYSLEITEKTF